MTLGVLIDMAERRRRRPAQGEGRICLRMTPEELVLAERAALEHYDRAVAALDGRCEGGVDLTKRIVAMAAMGQRLSERRRLVAFICAGIGAAAVAIAAVRHLLLGS